MNQKKSDCRFHCLTNFSHNKMTEMEMRNEHAKVVSLLVQIDKKFAPIEAIVAATTTMTIVLCIAVVCMLEELEEMIGVKLTLL